jgi:hypothetical protein
VVKPFYPADLVARVPILMELSRPREALIAEGDTAATNLRAALATRATIGRAMDIIMAARRCDANAAFKHLPTCPNAATSSSTTSPRRRSRSSPGASSGDDTGTTP